MPTDLNIKITSPYGEQNIPFTVVSDDSDPDLKVDLNGFRYEVSKSLFPTTGSGTGEMIKIEVPTGAVNGVNTVYTTSFTYRASTVEVYINGLREKVANYTLSGGNTITMATPLLTGETIVVQASEFDAGFIDPARYVVGEIPSGAINGSNATFTTANTFVPETVQVFLNGIRLVLLADYNLSGGNTITLLASPLTGELVETDYIKTP